MMDYRFTVLTAPISKKNSQQIYMNPKTKKPFVMPSKAYKEYENAAMWFLKPKPKTPIDYPVEVRCIYYMPTHRVVDLVNLLEATDDVLVKAGVLSDDNCRIVVSHDGSRVLYDKERPRTEIEIRRYEVDNSEEGT